MSEDEKRLEIAFLNLKEAKKPQLRRQLQKKLDALREEEKQIYKRILQSENEGGR